MAYIKKDPVTGEDKIIATATNPETGERLYLDNGSWIPFKEDEFKSWYDKMAGETGLNPDPDSPENYYDYRTAFLSGAEPDEKGQWPSIFKSPEHPNRYVNGIDTISGEQAKTATNPETGERLYLHEGLGKWMPLVVHEEKAPISEKMGMLDRIAQFGRQSKQSVGKGAGNIMTGMATQLENTPVSNYVTTPFPGAPPVMTPMMSYEMARAQKGLPVSKDVVKRETIGKNPVSDMLRVGAEAYPEVEEGRPFGIFSEAINGFLEFAPAMALTAVSPGLGTAATFESIAGSKYNQYIKEGKDPETAYNASVLSAALTTPVEMAGNVGQLKTMGKLLQPFATKTKLSKPFQRYIGAVIKNARAEGIEEFTQEELDVIADTYADNPDANPIELASKVGKEYLTWDTHKRAARAGGVGALGGGLTTGVGGGTRLISDRMQGKYIPELKARIEEKEAEVKRKLTKDELNAIIAEIRRDKIRPKQEDPVTRMKAALDAGTVSIDDLVRITMDENESQELRDVAKQVLDEKNAETFNEKKPKAKKEAAPEIKAEQIEHDGKQYRYLGERKTAGGESVSSWQAQGKDGKWRNVRKAEMINTLDKARTESKIIEDMGEQVQAINKGVDAIKQKQEEIKPVEIPKITTTGEAAEFAKIATPEQLEEIKAQQEQYEKESYALRNQADAETDKAKKIELLNQSMVVSTHAQLMREVIEAKSDPDRFDINKIQAKNKPEAVSQEKVEAQDKSEMIEPEEAPIQPQALEEKPESEKDQAKILTEYPKSRKAEEIKGTKAVAQRIVNAENRFVDSVKEQFGFSDTEAYTILERFKKDKLVTIDPITGQYNLKTGAAWDKEVMQRAVDEGMGAKQSPEQIKKEINSFFEGDKKAGKVDKKIAYTDRSVRDHGQRAVLKDDAIVVENKSGKKKIGSFIISLQEWEQTEKGPSANPNYNKRELIKRKHIESFPGNLENGTLTSIAERIIDSEIRAVETVFKEAKKRQGKDLENIGKVEGKNVKRLLEIKDDFEDYRNGVIEEKPVKTETYRGKHGETKIRVVDEESIAEPKTIEDELSSMSVDDIGAMFDEVVAEKEGEQKAEVKAEKATETKLIKEETVSDYDKYSDKLRKTGSARINDVDYKILKSDAGYYFSRTENGIRVQEGGGYPNKWSMEYAIDRALMDAGLSPDLIIHSLETDKSTILKGAETQTKSAADIIKQAAKEGVKGIDETAKGLYELFGGSALKSFPGGIDAETYAKAKPHFEAGYKSFVNAGKSMKDFIRWIVDNFGAKVKPYLMKWAEDKKSGIDKASDKDYNIGETEKVEGGEENARQIRKSDKESPDTKRNGESEGTQEGQLSEPVLSEQGKAGEEGERRPADHGPERKRSGRDGNAIPSDYSITDADNLGKGGPKQKYHDNIAAIKLLKELGDRQATPDEQSILAKYVGWGGLPQAFTRPDGTVSKGWESEVKELKELLTDDEYIAARRSTQDAHYTSQTIINGIYNVLDKFGFTKGRILEPSVGVGNFLGLMPKSIRSNSKITGVELDSLTAAIAKQLYPKQNIFQSGFQEVSITPESYDLVIGNPPFGDTKITDLENRDLKGFSIHNYFFAKGIKALRPRGIMAMVVSSSMMDKIGDTQRSWIIDHADLIGAIRLPNNAFRENALTEVTTDIIFLQKREAGEAPRGEAWLKIKIVDGKENQWRINEYFANHPEMMLGELAPNKLHPAEIVKGVYDAVPGMIAKEGVDIAEAMQKAIDTLPNNIYSHNPVNIEESQRPEIIVSDPGYARPYGYALDDQGKAVRRLPDKNGTQVYEPVLYSDKPLTGNRLDRFKSLLKLRDDVRRLIRAELSDSPDMDKLRKVLNKRYDTFVEKYGYISNSFNSTILKDDPVDLPLLRSLEMEYDAGISAAVAKRTGEKKRQPSAKKAAIFTQRVRQPYQKAKKADNPKDGLAIVLREDGFVNIKHIAELTNKDEESIISELSGIIFKNPSSESWEIADTYLSGNVKQKLREARDAALIDSVYEQNVKSLEKVQPKDVPADLIPVRIGNTWIPTEVYEKFAKDILKIEGPYIYYSEKTGQWAVKDLSGEPSQFDSTKWSAGKIFATILGSRDISVYTKDSEGNRIFDKDATDDAKDKAAQMQRAFQDWVLNDIDNREVIEQNFNDKINTTVAPKYDGSHMIFPGMGVINPEVKRDDQLRQHQKNVVWRAIQRGKVLFDHVVGSGKTYAAIATGLEMKRMGLINKPMYVVPNHLIEQWATDFQRLYPGANVLTINKKDFSKNKRQEFMGRIATGNWDAVVIAHSSFGFVPSPRDYELRFYADQIAQYEEAISAIKAEQGSSISVKQMEKSKDKLKEKLKALADKPKDAVADFSELGVDALFVDEAHEFKNLYYTTKRTKVAGLGDQAGSKKAFDLFVKTRYLQDKNNDRGVFFLTGTPVSNSIAEMYTMMRYLDYSGLQNISATNFDQWASMFADATSDWEVDPTGTRYKLQTRFTFENLPGLMSIYKNFADIISNNDLRKIAKKEGRIWPIPDVEGGKPQIIVADRSDLQQSFSEWIVHRFDNMPKDPKEDNPLKATGEAMKAALDIRLIDETLPDHEGSKVNLCINKVLDIHKKWEKQRGAQLIFCDLSIPKKSKGKHVSDIKALYDEISKLESQLASETDNEKINDLEEKYKKTVDKLEKYSPAELMAADSNFSVYDDVKAKLIKRGIPEKEIAFIHDANTDKQKETLFANVRAGRIRVLIGSTSKMGAGMNVQNKLVALHHLDAPWRPSDLEQREGRIIRQGNEFFMDALRTGGKFEVGIYRYATEETLDTRRWQIIENKAKQIERLRSENLQWGEKIEDTTGEAANAAEMKAAASGNPLILDEIKTRREIDNTETAKRNARRNRILHESAVNKYEKLKTETPKVKELFRKDAETVNQNPKDKTPQGWKVAIGNKTFQAEYLVEVPQKLPDTADKKAIKKNAEDIKKAEDHNNEALKKAKELYAAELVSAYDKYKDTTGTLKDDEGPNITYRGIEWDVAKPFPKFPQIEIEPNIDSRRYVGLREYSTRINVKDGISPEGLLLRLDNILNNVEDIDSHIARLDKELKNAEIAASLKVDTAKETDFDKKLGQLRTRHKEILKELETSTTKDEGTKDFSMWEGGRRRISSIVEETDNKGEKDSLYYRSIAGSFAPVSNAKKVEINPELETFVYKSDNGIWYVVEAISGISIGDADTKTAAIEKAKNNIDKYGVEYTKEQISKVPRSPWNSAAPVFLMTGEGASFAQSLETKGQGRPMRRENVQKLVDKVKKAYPNFGEVEILNNQTEIPDSIHRAAGHDPELFRSGKFKVFAYFDPRSDKITLIANNFTSPRSVLSALIHESIGHRGVDAILTPYERARMHKLIKNAYADTVFGKQIIKDYGLDLSKLDHETIFGKEVIAHIAQTGENASLWDKIVAIIKNALRRLNIDLKLSDGEIRALLSRSAEYARTGKGGIRRPGTASYEQRATADIFYSALEKGVEGLKQETATPDQWQGMINKLPVKQEELEWVGLEDWLKDQKGKVTKQEILDFVRMNNVQVEEVQKKADDLERSTEYHQGAIEGIQTELPGGKNYKELLLRMPGRGERDKAIAAFQAKVRKRLGKQTFEYEDMTDLESAEYDKLQQIDNVKPTYKSRHWNESNVMAHIRFNDRTGPDGEKILFIEEIQSDWGQDGRKMGYKGIKTSIPEGTKLKRIKDPYRNMVVRADLPDGRVYVEPIEGNETDESAILRRLQRVIDEEGVPNMPFKKSWPLTAFKRMVRYAAENNYDTIAWTPGEVQADRYDLSKQLSKVSIAQTGDNEYSLSAFDKDNKRVYDKDSLTAEQLPDYIGKDLAEKAIKDTETGSAIQNYSGLDLKVGGEGMKGFYDKILPAEINKFFNKPAWGKAKVGVTKIGTPVPGFPTFTKDRSQEVWYLPVTEQMREKALYEGMPMYQRKSTEKVTITPQKNIDIGKETEDKIAFDPKTFDFSSEGIKNLTAKIYTTFFMQEYPIMRLAKKAGGNIAKAIEEQIRRVRGSGGITEAILTAGSKTPFIELAKDGITEYSHLGNNSLQKILKPLNTKDLYRDYERLREAERDLAFYKFRQEDIEKGKLKGIDPDHATEVINLLEDKYGAEGFKELQDISRAHTKFEQDAVLKTLLKSGWMSQEQYDAILARPESEFYASYLREMEDVERQVVGRGADPVKRIYGSEKKKIPSIEGTISNVLRTVRLVERLRLARQVVALRDLSPDLAEVIVKKKPRLRMAKVTFPQRDAKNNFVLDEDGNKVFKTSKIAIPVEPPRDTVTVATNGKKEYYELPPDVLDAINSYSYSAKEMNFAFKLMRYPTRLLRSGATLSAEFIMRNPARDQLTAYVYSKYGYNPFIDFARGLFHVIAKDELYQEFKAAGSENSFFVSLDRQAVNLTARDMTGQGNKIKYLKNPIEALRILSEFSEKGTRVGLYAKAKKKGASTQEAMTEAREGTLDFGRIGTEKALNQIIAFWNASLQGTDKMFREMRNGRAVLRALMGITVPSILLWLINYDDDRYKELPEWRKNFFWNIIIDDGPIISIPKPFELGLIFGSLPERILDWVVLNDADAVKDIGSSIAEGVFPSVIPTAALPLIEHITNYSFFRGQNLVPKSLENLPEHLQYGSFTSNTAKKVGKLIDVSPTKIENWVRGWTGTLGSGSLAGFDKVFMGDDIPDVGKNWYEITPGVKGFVSREPIGSGSKSVDKFYENAKKAMSAEAGYKFLSKHQAIPEAKKYAKNEKALISLARHARQYMNHMSSIRQRITNIIDNTNISSTEKRIQIDELNRQITKLAKDFNNIYDKMIND